MSQHQFRVYSDKQLEFETKINNLKNRAVDIINGLENVNEIIKNVVGSEDTDISSIDDLIQIFKTINLELNKLNKKNNIHNFKTQVNTNKQNFKYTYNTKPGNILIKTQKSRNIISDNILRKYKKILKISSKVIKEVENQNIRLGEIDLILGTFNQVEVNIDTFFHKIQDLKNDYIRIYKIRSFLDLIASKSKETLKTKKTKSLTKSKSKSKSKRKYIKTI